MSTTPSPSESREMLKWLTRNRRMLLDIYRNQYIAHNADRLIAHSENLQEVLALAEASGEIFVIYLVPRRCASVQILPMRFLPDSQPDRPQHNSGSAAYNRN